MLTFFKKKIFMLSEDLIGFPRQNLIEGNVEYEILSQGFDQISFSIVAESPQILIINSAFSPYWRVSVNRIESELFAAYDVLTGLYLPAGSHEVVLTHEPPYSFLTFYFKLVRLLNR